MTNPDPVSLSEDDADPVLLEVEVNVQREAERFLSLLLWEVMIVMIDQSSRFGNNEYIVNPHFGVRRTQQQDLDRKKSQLKTGKRGLKRSKNFDNSNQKKFSLFLCGLLS